MSNGAGGVSRHTQASTRLDRLIRQLLPSSVGLGHRRHHDLRSESIPTPRRCRHVYIPPMLGIGSQSSKRWLHLFKRPQIQACSTYTRATSHCRSAPKMPPEQTTAQPPPSTAVSAPVFSAWSVRKINVIRTEKCSDSPHRRSNHALRTTDTANAALPSNVFGLVASQRCRPSRLPAIEA